MKMLYPPVIYHHRHSSSLLLISILSLLCYTGVNCLTVKTCVGGDAVLPCEVDPTTAPTDMTVEWSRMDLPRDQYVYFQRNGQEFEDTKSPSYEGRTSLFMDEVKKGNVSLKLSSVKSSDEGNYTCFLPECRKEFTVQLIVEALARHPDSGSTEEFSQAETFHWSGYPIIIITTLVIIIIFIGVARCLLIRKRKGPGSGKACCSKTMSSFA